MSLYHVGPIMYQNEVYSYIPVITARVGTVFFRKFPSALYLTVKIKILYITFVGLPCVFWFWKMSICPPNTLVQPRRSGGHPRLACAFIAVSYYPHTSSFLSQSESIKLKDDKFDGMCSNDNHVEYSTTETGCVCGIGFFFRSPAGEKFTNVHPVGERVGPPPFLFGFAGKKSGVLFFFTVNHTLFVECEIREEKGEAQTKKSQRLSRPSSLYKSCRTPAPHKHTLSRKALLLYFGKRTTT